MDVIYIFFTKDILSKTADPGEKAKILLCFRFAIAYLFLTFASLPFCIVFQRSDILLLMTFLTFLSLSSLFCLKFCSTYKSSVIILAVYSLISALGNSFLASLSLSIIVFLWPFAMTVFISFTMGNRATLIYILLFAASVTTISILRIFNVVPSNPIDENRMYYSTGFLMAMSSVFLYYFLKVYDQNFFNKYTTAGRKGTNGEHSVGLGMYIIKKLLDIHKLEISVESQVNIGTTFRIEFPRSF